MPARARDLAATSPRSRRDLAAPSQGLLEMIRSTRLLDLSGLVLDKRNPSSMAIQLVHHNVAAGQSDKVNVFCQGCHDYVGEQECDVLRAKLTPQALLYSLWLRTRLTPRALHALSRTRQPTPTPAYAPPTAIATPRPPSASHPSLCIQPAAPPSQVRVLLLQLELPLAPTQLAARDGRARGVHVMLKLSPLPNSSLDKARPCPATLA